MQYAFILVVVGRVIITEQSKFTMFCVFCERSKTGGDVSECSDQ